MRNVPWWALSPSPFTALVWCGLAWYGQRYYARRVTYPKWQFMKSFVDSAFLLGIIVLTFDTYWCIGQMIRFGSLYPDDVFHMYLCMGRNIAAIAMCLFMEVQYYGKTWRITRFTVISQIALILFMVGWFTWASDITMTDWTKGIVAGYPWNHIFRTFVMSHVFAKTLQGISFITLFNHKSLISETLHS